MSLAVLHSRALSGLEASPVAVEVDLANGLPAFTIVGLPEAEVKEARERVRAAINNCGFDFPARRITVNLAPAELPKESGRFDLPIALGILAASRQIPADPLVQYEFAGELSLTGQLRPVRGALAMAFGAADSGRIFVLPMLSAAEACLVSAAKVMQADGLLEIVAHLLGRESLKWATPPEMGESAAMLDLADVRGQLHAKRALEVAAAGGHSMLMTGPPGTGKSMLASRMPGILPAMSDREALEAAAIQSLSTAGFDKKWWRRRPFRAPHHSASAVALVGGGSSPRPGEISLAHHGVLFLDEAPEFSRSVLEMLREPLESGKICISRAARQSEFPAAFQVVMAMNPCPCGYQGHHSHRCRCTPDQIARYRGRLSGPLLDRIDIQISVPSIRHDELMEQPGGNGSDAIRMRVEAARQRQLARQQTINARLVPRQIDEHCVIDDSGKALLEKATQQLNLSARGLHRTLKLARTVADLEGVPAIVLRHVAEAIQYSRPIFGNQTQ